MLEVRVKIPPKTVPVIEPLPEPSKVLNPERLCPAQKDDIRRRIERSLP